VGARRKVAHGAVRVHGGNNTEAASLPGASSDDLGASANNTGQFSVTIFAL
jgi:hypothetical protein